MPGVVHSNISREVKSKKYFLLILMSMCMYLYVLGQLHARAEMQPHLRQNQNAPGENSDDSASKEKKPYFTLRIGQGGFSDKRSPLGKLGGGQLTLDIKPGKLPLALSISSEYYTNSADPSHSHEIPGLVSINILYTAPIFKSKRVNFFMGGGMGRLKVPKGEDEPDAVVRGTHYNLEAGMNVRVFWKIGFYGTCKYLYAKKAVAGIDIIDFKEFIILLGITFNFSL